MVGSSTFANRASAFFIRICIAVLATPVLLASSAICQEQVDQPSLHGIVRDAAGKPVAKADLRLHSQSEAEVLTSTTDDHGEYRFADLVPGVYELRASMAGYHDASISSIFLQQGESKAVDVVFDASAPAQNGATPAFYDEPRFTVSGVTDTTSLGGHGSDTVVHARDSLAKDTAALSKPTAAPASSSIENALREQVKREPQNVKANRQLGELLLNAGKAREAISYLARACALTLDDRGIAYELARAAFEAGDLDRARTLASAIADGEARVHHLLGDVQEKLGNSLDAVREFQRAAEMEPSEPYLFDWGAELLLHHAPEPASEVFNNGSRLFQKSTRMLIGLGASFFARGSYDQAVEAICQASDLDPDNPTPYIFLGKIDRADSAISAVIPDRLRRFATQHPESAQANYDYAAALWKRRKAAPGSSGLRQAESLLNAAIRLDAKFGAAYLQLGILHAEQRDFTKAIADYQRGIQCDPQMEEAHYRLAQAYRQVGEVEKAKAEIDAYEKIAKETEHKNQRERHEIQQFVYTLRGPS